MNRAALLMRDPAAAAILGALPSNGADFGDDGYDDGSGGGYTYDPGEWDGVSQAFGDFAGDFGWEPEFGYSPSFGDEFGAAPPTMQDMLSLIASSAPGAPVFNVGHGNAMAAAAARPAAAAFIAAQNPAFAQAYAQRQHSRSRAMLLEPNLNSSVKVERFVFPLSQVITALGTGQALSLRDTPDTNIRPQRVTMNAPSVGFATIGSIRVGNVDAIVGADVDAFDFNANGQGQSLDMPTLKTATKLTVEGTYTGLVPSPLTGTGPYTFTVSFKGPSTLTA